MWAMIISGLFALDTRRSLAYQLFAVLVVLLLVAWLATRWRRPEAVELNRVLPTIATVGTTFHYRLRIHAPGLSGRNLWVREVLSGALPDAAAFRRLREPGASGRGWFDRTMGFPRWLWLLKRSCGADTEGLDAAVTSSETAIDMKLTPLRRGYLHFSGLEIGYSEPLGVCRVSGTQAIGGRLLVFPRRVPVADSVLPGGGQHRLLGAGLVSTPGQSDEFLGLREYRPGDQMKHIHWKRFATLGEPIVREFHQQASQRVAVLLDCAGALNGDPRFESAVEVAASIAEHAHNHDGAVDLVLPESVTSSAGPDAAGLDGVLAKLACANGSLEGSVVPMGERVLAASQQMRGVVCILLNWDAERRRLLDVLVAQGLSVKAIVITDARAEVGLHEVVSMAGVRFVPADAVNEALAA
jgi:uncharacterized protein (DUF58 family)